ncbi:MAG TPA: O-antigen ligase family protein [Candidatus Dormibacteraeota bacterium]
MSASRAFARLAAALSFAYVLRGRALGVPFTTLELALLGLVAVYVVEKLVRGERFPDPRRMPYFWPLALLLVAATISVLVAPDRRAAAGIWKAYFLEPSLGAYVIADVFRTRLQVGKLLQGFFVGGVVVAVLNELAFALAVAVHRPHLTEAPVVVLYNTPNATGLFLAPLVAAAVAMILFGNARERGWGWIFTVVATPAVAFSFSRGAWLGLGVAFVLLAVIHPRRRVLSGGLAVVTALTLLLPPVRKRVAHEFNPTDPFNSVNTRVDLWKATTRMMTHGLHPLLGAGLSGFKQAIAPYKDISGYNEDLIYPHNSLLTFWAETGLLGLLAFVWLIVDASRRSWVALRARTPMHVYHAAFAAAAVTIVVHGMLDVPFFKNDLAWMTLALLGMHAAALRHDQQQTAGDR